MNSIAGDTDCQKVNCPEGAREATLGCVASLLAMTAELRYPAEGKSTQFLFSPKHSCHIYII